MEYKKNTETHFSLLKKQREQEIFKQVFGGKKGRTTLAAEMKFSFYPFCQKIVFSIQ